MKYQLSTEDLISFSRAYRRLASSRIYCIYWFLLLPIFMVGLSAFTEFGLAAIFTILFASAVWLLGVWDDRQFNRAVFAPDHVSALTLPMQATLSEEGAHFASDASHTFYRWQFVRDVSRLGDYLCFTVTPIERVYIPIRAFRDDAHLSEFLSTAQSFANDRHGSQDGALQPATSPGSKSE